MKPLFRSLLLVFLTTLAFAQNKPGSRKGSHPSATHKKSAASATSPQAVHQSAIIVDTHADTPQRFLDEHFDLGQNTPVSDGHIDLSKIKQGNLGAEFFSIWVEPEFKGQYSKRAM